MLWDQAGKNRALEGFLQQFDLQNKETKRHFKARLTNASNLASCLLLGLDSPTASTKNRFALADAFLRSRSKINFLFPLGTNALISRESLGRAAAVHCSGGKEACENRLTCSVELILRSAARC